VKRRGFGVGSGRITLVTGYFEFQGDERSKGVLSCSGFSGSSRGKSDEGQTDEQMTWSARGGKIAREMGGSPPMIEYARFVGC